MIKKITAKSVTLSILAAARIVCGQLLPECGLTLSDLKWLSKFSTTRRVARFLGVKAWTALKTKKIKYGENDFQYGGWNSYTLQYGTIMTLISSGDCTLHCNVACGSWIVIVNSPSGSNLDFTFTVLVFSIIVDTCIAGPVRSVVSLALNT